MINGNQSLKQIQDKKIYLLAEFTILPGFMKEVKATLKEALIPTLQEPGCEALYEPGRNDDPNRLVFFEVFSSAVAHEFHLAQDYTKRMFASLEGNVSGVTTWIPARDLTSLSVDFLTRALRYLIEGRPFGRVVLTIGQRLIIGEENMKQLTDQEGKKMKVIDNYEKGVENSDESLLKEVFASQVRIEIPTGTTNNYPVNTASYILSQVAKTAPRIKCVLSADAGNNWYFLGFEGQIQGQKLQAVDQVHLNNVGKIDQLIIYMRPIPVAQKFAELISQRLQPTGSSSERPTHV